VPKSSDYKDAIKALRAIAPNSGLPDYVPQTNEESIRFNNAWGFGGSPWDSAEGYSTGDSWYDPLKSFGKGALNVLSVPQAAAVTTISKLLEGAGVKGEGAMDWSDALGGFSENYRGFDELLGQLGVEDSAGRRAVGLGLDIVADPLWLFAPAKVLRTVDKVTELPGDIAKLRQIGPGAVDDVPRQIGPGAVDNVPRQISPPAPRQIESGTDNVPAVRGSEVDEPMPTYNVSVDYDNITPLRDIGEVYRAGAAPGGARTPEGGPLFNEFLDPEAAREFGPKIVEKMGEKYSAKYNVGIRLGLGKFKKTLDTKVHYPSRALDSMSGAWARAISMLPSEQAAHALRRSEREMSDLSERFIRDLQKQHNLSDEQAGLMSLAAAVRNAALDFEGAKTLDDAEELINVLRQMRGANGEALWTPAMDNIINSFGDRWVQWRQVTGGGFDEARPRGSYSPQMPSTETREMLNKYRRPSDSFVRSMSGSQPIADEARSFGSMFNYYTTDSFKKMLGELGIADEAAELFTTKLDEFLKAQDATSYFRALAADADEPFVGFRQTDRVFPDGPAYRPETNFFSIAAAKESSERSRLLDNQITDLFEGLGFIKKDRFGNADLNMNKGLEQAQKMYRIYQDAMRQRILSNTELTSLKERALKFTSLTKIAFTTPWPSHFVNNMLGDITNSSVEGTFLSALRNAKSNLLVAGKPAADGSYRLRRGDKFARLSNYEKEQLTKTFKIGDTEYTGEELLALAHLVGLGRGLVGENVVNLYADLNSAYKMFESTRNPFQQYWRFMQRQNIAREDAIRFRTWVRHMERGADPIEAGFKTIEGIFDYGALTRIEKLYLRNLLLFYTWMRLNTPFQVRGMAKKPGLYSAFGDIERDRPKMPNEPDYISDLGGINIPGVGLFTFGAPWADLYRLPTLPGLGGPDRQGLTESFRQNILSSLNPIAKVPLELATNTSMFSGGKIEKYPGELKPTKMPFLAGLLNQFGVGEAARTRKGGEMTAAVPANIAYLLDQTGPFATNTQRFFGPEDKSPGNGLDLALLLAGLKRTVPNPDWERQQAVKAASRQAAETRRKNATSTNPNYSGR